jgi:hypothetical protein
VMMLAVVVLFAAALDWLGHTYPRRRRLMMAIVTALLLAELLPAPMTLHSAAVPTFYHRVAATPGDVRVLELPTGIRDGTSSIGDFTARSQFFQTVHEKPLIGGYLSRVGGRSIAEVRRIDMLDALIVLSEGGRLSEEREAALISAGPDFIREANLGFVIVDRLRSSQRLIDFATRALHLRLADRDGVFELYQPIR